MALYMKIYKEYPTITKHILWIVQVKFSRRFEHNGKSNSVDVDVLDDFTTKLVQKKTDKWDIVKAKNKIKTECHRFAIENPSNLDLQHLDEKQVASLLQEALDGDNVERILSIVQHCSEHKICPSLFIMTRILVMCSQSGDKETVTKISNLCKSEQPLISETNSEFKHYLAEATWMRGNVLEGLKLFDDVYRHNTFLRRKIRLMLKSLIPDVISNHSEAVLQNLIKFSLNLAKDFKDYYMLACVWQSCVLSEWFTDQSIAIDLMMESEVLCKAVADRIPHVVTISLRNQQIDVVFRLLEVFLKHEHKAQYGGILISLFDYRFRQGDLRSCSEIIRWSLQYDVTLPTLQQERFLILLLKYKSDETIKPVKSTSPAPYKF